LGERSGASKRLKKAASEEGALLPLFVAPSQLKPFISKELKDGPLKPIDYQDGDRIVRGYDASVLVVVCNIWLSARQAGALQAQQLPKAQKAELLTRALAETGIVALVDEATGYEKVRPQNALQRYLEILVRKELAAWAKKFPDEFYENIYCLNDDSAVIAPTIPEISRPAIPGLIRPPVPEILRPPISELYRPLAVGA
jgi:hypothetical protein